MLCLVWYPGKESNSILNALIFAFQVKNSSLTFELNTKYIENVYRNIWFPEGYRLQVEAAITERSTGVTERAIDNSFLFTQSPYQIKVVNTAKYFRPGLQFPIKVCALFGFDFSYYAYLAHISVNL